MSAEFLIICCNLGIMSVRHLHITVCSGGLAAPAAIT